MSADVASSFSTALRTLNADDRGRISIGSVVPAARGGSYSVAVDRDGRILLTPTGKPTRKRVSEHE
ncbi:hypothetical protein G7068_16250 [Leucobacter viscericola]|uniref:Uncharacterized protein n=1 Tax=Leucobacter viscericola TaxID=2714935 RepID=A0A6G7XJJ2_9MICO|nr:hypothetical protein [Leucobacter viscericola]QIK64525.1 hypothetical protein G7068_15880 [Leucobacter viscericola]QIK64599.1 hypothetical protein G7068_16250 [Leucobacter viscericola]